MKSLLIVSILLFTHCVFNSDIKTVETPAKGFAVVELFTSEGCSSCPPADKAVADLLSKNIDDVFVLVYHVDYWDRLGWKDEFSQKMFSERQRKYATMFSSSSVYTPQIIFNGTAGFVGSNVGKINKEVRESLEHNVPDVLEVNAAEKNNYVNITYKMNQQDGILINVAFIQPQAERQIKAGENNGLTLNHVNIVRDFKSTAAAATGNVSIKIPDDLTGKDYNIIAFTQSRKTYKILSAKQIHFKH